MEEIVQLIANVGFPIVVAVYMIVKVDKTNQELLLAITKLTERIENMEDKVKNDQ